MTSFSHMLYVEDDPRSREIMDVLVTQLMGIPKLTMFADSADFMTRVNQLAPPPDVILLDIHVPPHNGFEMLRMLRDDPRFRTMPIVALTASVMNEEIHRLRQAGFDGVIAKPIDMDRFPDLLRRIMAGETIWQILN